jgi:hypothetical protein
MTVVTVMTVVYQSGWTLYPPPFFFSNPEKNYFGEIFFDPSIVIWKTTVITVTTVILKKTNRETYS